MNCSQENIKGVFSCSNPCFSDSRGAFFKHFGSKDINALFGDRRICQVNHSVTVERGTVRGMHFQLPPYAEMKLITCLRGRVFDVALDLRAGSPTFGKYDAFELVPGKMIVIPEGCAHGFQVLEQNSELLYLHSAGYESSYERGVNIADPDVNIKWPLKPVGMSERDLHLPFIESVAGGIVI